MKENSILTTKELSRYLKLNEKTIIKMAQSGELPGFKVGNKWRFYLSTIDEYLQDKIVRSPKRNRSGIIGPKSGAIPLSRLTDESCINMDMKSRKPDGILYELAEIAQESGIAVSIENLLIQLKKREQMLSTAIGKGVAIPPPRNPSDELFRKTGLIIGRSAKGLDFDAPDGKKVHLFFMTCATDVVLHLNLLSKIARLLDADGFIKRMIRVKSKKDIMKLLLESERTNILALPK
ncbi:MAG: hypothetical protein A2Z72_00480 [Omnitrophica bacterium RBG_13_46_9]|nr:MAG: hypothetical protein A2Z72_00480 [Omnitrophica bacterium RBG_13_46_9]